MATQQAEFGSLLRQYRIAAGLSQEALAERARLSVQAISALERGVRRTPYLATVRLLADALELSALERAALAAAGRRDTPGQDDAWAAAGRAAVRQPDIPIALPLLGRADEEATVAALLQQEDVRLVTLTGPGGVGKTSLGMHVAAAVGRFFDDGVACVALASVSEASLVAPAVARTLGVQESHGRPVVHALREYLRNKHILLVLDNVEHVVASAPFVADLLEACHGLKVLATSRAALRLRVERAIEVAPLALPDPGAVDDVPVVAQSPAVQLFVQRAGAVKVDFALTTANVHAVAEICRRLDGLPLAIELAASWVKLLSPGAILARLERRLPLLSAGPVDLPSRHQTMHNAIAWSYDLLDAQDQRLFRRLAVFAGSCTVEAAEAVGGDVDADGAPAAASLSVLHGLASLTHKSLLRQVEQVDGDSRLSMLGVLREFGLERLAAAEDADAVFGRHAAYFLRLAEQAEAQLRGPERRPWLDRLEQEHDNLRAALQWARQRPEQNLGLRLAVALWQFWWTRGHLREGSRWLEDLLALWPGESAVMSPTIHARARQGAATLAAEQGDYTRALTHCDESDRLSRDRDDTWGIAWIRNVRGVIARRRGDYQRATAYYEESLSLYRQLNDRWSLSVVLNNLGALARYQGDNERAERLYAESLALTRTVGDMWNTAMVLVNLGEVARDQGDDERAVVLAEESLALFYQLGERRGTAHALLCLGAVANRRNEYEHARAFYRESLSVDDQLGDQSGVAASLEGLSAAEYGSGDAAQAARLLGAAAALRERIEVPVSPADRPDQDRLRAAVATALGSAFDAAWQVGQALPLKHVIATALHR